MKALLGNIINDDLMRVRLFVLVMLMGLGAVVWGLWSVQVARGAEFQRDAQKLNVRRVRLPPMRGRIFDRHGVVLADNRPSYDVAVYLEEMRRPGAWSNTIAHVDMILDRLGTVLGIERQVDRDDIATHVKRRLPLPMTVWRDIDEKAMARLAERVMGAPGIAVQTAPVRSYPGHRLAGHVLGYMGRADPQQNDDEEMPFHYYLPEWIGRAGIEASYDEDLRGEPGGQLVRVDASGYRHQDLKRREPKNGNDLRMALDSRVQRLAEAALGDEPGAMVVVDPRNGDVLAMASTPSIDPNGFVPYIPAKLWNALLQDEDKPLLNRALSGTYAPGSTFKPFVAMAALDSGMAEGGTTFTCRGYMDLGRARFRCWTRGQHGPLVMSDGLKYSCNVYFCRLGLEIGPDPIQAMAHACGLGARTGIELAGEAAGLVPDNAWYLEHERREWSKGDTCNISIGQGALNVTPLQMALATAAIANGGKLYWPRLALSTHPYESEIAVRTIPPRLVRDLDWSDASLAIVRKGMHDVVMSERGTGRLAAVEGLTMGGKTGTAEYGKKSEGRKHAWMIAYAPWDNPRYAVAVMVENGISGGVSCGPMIKQLFSGIFPPPADGGAG